ncbi:hypothetical protein CFP56_021183 [Quercus suber]|uniref:Uncharacterized protein n=1 Tax=Quercus suber TaxID=58331 RepID=A0AAW0KDW4_QUESU
MKSLKLLSLYGCKRVKRFPDIPQEMENLKYKKNRCEKLHFVEFRIIKKINILGTFPSLKVIETILVTFANTFSRFAKLQFLKILNCMQFERKLGLPQDMKCVGVKGNVLMDLHSLHNLLHQIDFSSWVSLSKFDIIKDEFIPTLDAYLMRDMILEYHERRFQSGWSSILFWVGPKFPIFALCVVFHLGLLKDSFANNDSYGSIHDDIINLICDLRIFINGHKRPFIKPCDHLWFYSKPHSQLQRMFGDLMQGDQNHVEISSKISHWTCKFGKFAPMIVRMGVHAECICSPRYHPRQLSKC